MMQPETADTLDIGPCPGCGRRNGADARFCGACGKPLRAISAEMEAHDADPLIGQVVADRYRIVSLLGRGGMGVVYKVEHVHIGKIMAMKLLHGELARNKETVKRFRREAEAASRLSHPNTVSVFDFGRSDGLMYLVMEYLEGDDLGELIRANGSLDFERVARLCAQVCASVGEAHALGIVHRDLKPENVMIVASGHDTEVAKVLDFGLAKLRDHAGGMTVTRAGAIVGTPYYMSPEQIRGEPVDARGDVYSIGAMIYKAVTGVPPFSAENPMGVLTKHLTDDVVPPTQRTTKPLPPVVDTICIRALAKDPDRRFQSAEELRHGLLEHLEAIGADLSDPTLRSSPGRSDVLLSAPVARLSGDYATKAEVEAYETQLRRRGLVGYGIATLMIVGLLAGGAWFWRAREPKAQIATVEHEPNQEMLQANPLPEGVVVRGKLGKRQDSRFGDADFFRIENPGEVRRTIAIHTTGLPNLDMVVDVFRDGRSRPLLSANGARFGLPELVPNFPIQPGPHFIRVRERWVTGELPTENVSDEYELSWRFVDAAERDESEVNDTLALANPIQLGETRRGYIGWDGDLDVYCLAEAGEGLRGTVTIEDGAIDLVLRVVTKGVAFSETYDRGGVGEAEIAYVPAALAGQHCFELSAAVDSELAQADGAHPYSFTVAPGEPLPEEPAEEGAP